jgi:hypothetical protein
MKVSYHKRFSPEGTVYNQAVSMKLSEMAHLKMVIDTERELGFPRVKQYDPEGKNHAELFLKPLRIGKGALNLEGKGVIYLNLTQRRFMELYLHGEIKKRVKDRNTCILIKQS